MTPEEAHQIGLELAKEIMGGKYEFVLTTHIDCGHIHNHVIWNAVSFTDHRHYHSNKRSYYEIRRASDRLCKEHGLSVIVPGQERGKSYVEHQAVKSGTSYKAKLKAAIDRLLPVCTDLEDLLRRLQEEGYEIRRGKYISCRASNQDRFTRLKTLGIDYTEEALAARIAGRTRPSKRPKVRDGSIQRIAVIQDNQSPGLQHWAKLQKLKEGAKTLNYLAEHGIDSYEALERRLAELNAALDDSLAAIKAVEGRIAELNLIAKYAATYRKCRAVYNHYRKSEDKEKFLRGHESEIILFEAAARELKRLEAVPLPTAEKLGGELSELTVRKGTLYAQYTTAKRQAKEYDTIKRNLDILLPPEQSFTHELE